MTKSRHRKSRWQDPILVAGPLQQIQQKFHPLYAFGFDGYREKSSQVACVDSHVIVYGLGGNIVFHSISTDKVMKFFSSSVAVEAVLWVEGSPGGSLVAACEKLKTGLCQVSVIDSKRLEAVNTFPAYGHGEFGACAFSDNERHFMAACNADHMSQLDFWDVRDGRVMLSTTVPYEITKITFNPMNMEEFAVSGPLQFKFWTFKDGVKKEIHVHGLHDQKDKNKQDPMVTYTDHVWLVETSVALSTANGKIFIVRNYSVQHIITDSGHTLCLLRTHRGFLAGKQDGSLSEYIGFDLYKVKIAEKEQKNPYSEVRPVTLLSGLSPIASMVMPPNGEQIIYLVEGDRVLKVHLGIGDDEDALLGADTGARIVPMSVFRMGKISGMDICTQRMLLVTCGSDCLLRVWSYQRMICEITHTCDEEPQLVTISPWGHYLFVAMARRIQIFRIVGYKLQHCKDIGGVKNIRQMKFSPSGHMVAAANSREILLICAITWKIKATLKGHTGALTALAWSPDSIYLTSAGLDGAIYGWFLDGYHRYLEYVIKGSVYSSLLVDPKRTFVLACGPSLPLRVIDTDKKLGVSHGREHSVIGEELIMAQKDTKETVEGGFSSTIPPTPESSHTPSSSVSPIFEDPVHQTPVAIRPESPRESLAQVAPAVKKRDSTVGTEEHPEGSWVQHKYRSNCVFELTHEKPVTLMAGLFKSGVLITTSPGGELRMYTYPFARDAPNLLKEVILLTTGEITGLCIDEERRLIFASTTQGSIFISTVDTEVMGPKVDDPYEDSIAALQEVIPVIPGIMQYLQDSGTDALNILLERDEVEEMKRDLVELKLTMAREVKDASFRAQRAALEWSADMKEREAGYLARAREYDVKVTLLTHNLHLAINEKETSIQDLLEAQRATTEQLEAFYQNKLAQELEGSHISRTQFQKDLAFLELQMKDKEQIYLEKMVQLERELEDADARAQEAIKKIKDECKEINDNYKLEMEEDLLLSDEELNQALKQLNTDVNVEKVRADENYEQLLQEKRRVMKAEKKMKDMQDVHGDHVELIQNLTAENADLKKTVMELDYEKRVLKKVVLITDEKTQHLVHERKDQETKTIVRDFKIQQLRKREEPLEREALKLRFQLKEMERHQLSHVMELKHQTLIVDNLRARVAVLEEDIQKLSDQLHERECYVDMFTRALCQLVQEHDVSEWPQLTRQLYFTYVKDVHRTDTLEHLDAYGQVMHQRENLEKFVAILQQEISRSEVRNWRETHKYMQQNLDMLHEYNESQRNVKRLAFATQKLQGDVAYWKAIAAKPEKRLRSSFDMSTAKGSSTQPDNRSNSLSRCSKSTRKSTPSNKLRASLVPSLDPSRASSPGYHEKPDTEEEERVKELFRSSTPVAHILKPYLHRGTIAAAATNRYTFTQNTPWSPEPQSEKDRAMILDLNIQLNDMKKELRRKDDIIQGMQRDSRLRSSFNYLPPTRAESIIEGSAREESMRSGVQVSPDQMDDTASSRRPKSVPTLRGRSFDGRSGTDYLKRSSLTTTVTDDSNPRPLFSGNPNARASWTQKPPDSSSDHATFDLEAITGCLLGGFLRREESPPPSNVADGSAVPGGRVGFDTSNVSRRSTSPAGLMQSLLYDNSSHPDLRLSRRPSTYPTNDPSPSSRPENRPRRSSSPLGPGRLDHSPPPIASSETCSPNLSRRSSSPGGVSHPRIVSLQLEDSSLAAEKSTGIDGAVAPPAMVNPSRSSSSPPRIASIQEETPPVQMSAGLINPVGSLSSPRQPGLERRKSSLMKVETAGSLPVTVSGSDSTVVPLVPRRNSSLSRTASSPRLPAGNSETSSAPFRRKSSRFEPPVQDPLHSVRRASLTARESTSRSVARVVSDLRKSVPTRKNDSSSSGSSSADGSQSRRKSFVPSSHGLYATEPLSPSSFLPHHTIDASKLTGIPPESDAGPSAPPASPKAE